MKSYFPQLDNLRGIAVLLVIISHWFDKEHFINLYLDNGAIGVTIFFVLSGFLITGILLRSKLRIEQGNETIAKSISVFYIKMALRIFPVYYFLIVLLLIADDKYLLQGLGWHLTYTSNFYFYLYEAFAGGVTVFWSLSVEEQFYLFWPAIIYYTPSKKKPFVFCVGILTAVIFRYFIITDTSFLGRLLMPGSFDSFCIGAFIAYAHFFPESTGYKLLTKYRNEVLALSLVFFAGSFLVSIHNNPFHSFKNALYFLLISISFGIWISIIVQGVRGGVLGYVLDNEILRYVGKISYGMYLFHMFIPNFYGIKFSDILEPFGVYIIFTLRMILLIAISSFSWFLLERPLLRLKNIVELRMA
jgi:peptidoglycan/LPS O-acetylase OafA/YrhL